jgi:hypothetical protein
MRITRVVVLIAALATPALAADWERYDNARFGYTIEVPPEFSWGAEADNGDGRQFRDGATRLAVWGGNLMEPDLETSARSDLALAETDGWTITYEAITPRWASFSGTRGNRVLYERMIALCEPGQYAGFLLEYSSSDIARLDPIVTRLVRSLEPTGC